MSALFLSLVLQAATVADPRGFQFTLPEGFTPFPNFQPTGFKLHAYGKNLGTPDAITLTIDLVDGPVTAGQPSLTCGLLLNSIDRTVGKPITQRWQALELSGLRMLMTHTFGEVVVLCLDVPIAPNGLTVMVSGKPSNEAALQQTFEGVLSSLENPAAQPVSFRRRRADHLIALALLRRRHRRGN